jgi:hypothetical protein
VLRNVHAIESASASSWSWLAHFGLATPPEAPVTLRWLMSLVWPSGRFAILPIEDLMTDPDEFAYDTATFPPGCVCSDCRRSFEHGDRYSQRLLVVSDGVTLVEVVCLRCALAPLEWGT